MLKRVHSFTFREVVGMLKRVHSFTFREVVAVGVLHEHVFNLLLTKRFHTPIGINNWYYLFSCFLHIATHVNLSWCVVFEWWPLPPQYKINRGLLNILFLCYTSVVGVIHRLSDLSIGCRSYPSVVGVIHRLSELSIGCRSYPSVIGVK